MSISRPITYKEILDNMIAGMTSQTPITDLEKGSVFKAYLEMIEKDLHRQKLLFVLQKLDPRFRHFSWESVFHTLTNYP